MSAQMEQAAATAMQMVTAYGMSVIGAVIILIVGWIISGFVFRTIRGAALRSERIDDTIGIFLAGAARYGVLVFTVVAVLARFGVQTASIIAVLGALGIAVGLALQGTLSNVAAGLMILFLRPFKIGDYIEAGSTGGTVTGVSLFTTEMNTPDNVRTVVPNGQIIGGIIKNYSTNPTRRLDIVVGIAYEDDIDKAFAVMKAIVDADNRILNDPEPQYLVSELADSSVNITARFWCGAGDYWPIKFELTKAFKEAFDKNGITIPFPQRDVHYPDRQAAE